MADHPITPPPELVERLRGEAPHVIRDRDGGVTRERHLAIAAYRAGADAELEACCALIESTYVRDRVRAARRPKPPSVAEEALRILVENSRTFGGCVQFDLEDVNTICRALKRLQELENGNG